MIRPRTLILLYHYLAGTTDTCTGLLLLFAPAFALHVMGVSQLPHPIWFASYIGVFVFCVGASYFAVLRGPFAQATRANCWRTQWMITALIRSGVAVFILAQIATGVMQIAWITVAFTDGLYALIQWIGLRRNWIALAE
jgi:vacuolar-type H+-ATPase subunit I/STV1